MHYYSKSTDMANFVLLMVFILIGVAIGSFTWPYTINTWLVFFGKEPTVVWWQGLILGLLPFVGCTSIPVVHKLIIAISPAVVTWILMLFIG